MQLEESRAIMYSYAGGDKQNEICGATSSLASPPLVATSTPLQQIPCVDRHNVFDDVANEYMQQQIMQDRTAREIHSHEQTLRLQIYENLLMRRGR